MLLCSFCCSHKIVLFEYRFVSWSIQVNNLLLFLFFSWSKWDDFLWCRLQMLSFRKCFFIISKHFVLFSEPNPLILCLRRNFTFHIIYFIWLNQQCSCATRWGKCQFTRSYAKLWDEIVKKKKLVTPHSRRCPGCGTTLTLLPAATRFGLLVNVYSAKNLLRYKICWTAMIGDTFGI